MYEIRTAPIPKSKTCLSNVAGESRYPFAKLEIGQSFFVPNKDLNPPADLIEASATFANMRTHVSRHNRKILPDRKFQCAISGNFIQVWRIS